MSLRTSVICCLLSVYLASYATLSRLGFEEARRHHFPGFYYFPPENTARWRTLNSACRIILAPLNWIDQILGLGEGPAYDPMFELSECPKVDRKSVDSFTLSFVFVIHQHPPAAV